MAERVGEVGKIKKVRSMRKKRNAIGLNARALDFFFGKKK